MLGFLTWEFRKHQPQHAEFTASRDKAHIGNPLDHFSVQTLH